MDRAEYCKNVNWRMNIPVCFSYLIVLLIMKYDTIEGIWRLKTDI